MKLLITLFTLAFSLCVTTYGDDLPEGHWLSQKLDKTNQVLITYENWFEQNESGERVFHTKVVKKSPYTEANPTAPALAPKPLAPASTGKWYCFAHDFINGHTNADPKDDSCVGAHFKGAGACREDAIERALAQCHARSSNHSTCEINPKVNCFSEKSLPQTNN